MFGKCGLCGIPSELLDSHYIPKSIYKKTRSGGLIFGEKSNQSVCYNDAQITKYYLCKCCEDRFNKNGEKYILPLYQINKNHFKIRKILEEKGLSSKYYLPSSCVSQVLNIDKLLYFIISIIWRGVSTKWENYDADCIYGFFNHALETKIKKYLLNEGPIPEEIVIQVDVFEPCDENMITTFPTGDKDGYIQFIIPGIKFGVYFKKAIEPKIYKMSKEYNSIIFFTSSSFYQSEIRKHLCEVIQNSGIKGKKLIREMKNFNKI